VCFYERVLGFEVLSRDDDVGGSGFATVGRGAGRVMLASPPTCPGRVGWRASSRSRLCGEP